MKRMYYYDNLKLLLIFLVIFGHFCEISAGSTTYGAFLKFYIYIFHIPLFIFVSGLFHSNSSKEKVARRSIGFLLIYFLMKVVSLLDHMIMYGEWDFTLFDEGGMPWFMLAMSVWPLMAYVTRDTSKKALFAVSILVALAAGYDYSITTQFSISRIIVYWPFFLAGEMTDRETLLSFAEKRMVKCIGAGLLIAATITIWLTYDKISVIAPMLSGKNAYDSLADPLVSYGGLVRLGTYVLTAVFSLIIMAVVPTEKLFCTKYGSRTLSIYFLGLIVYHLSYCYFPDLRIWQYFIISIFLIPILGNSKLNRFLAGMTK